MGSTLWSLSCVYASTETQGQEVQTMSACVPGLLKKNKMYLEMENFILGMNFCGMNDEIHRVIGLCCQGCPLCLRRFHSTGNSHQESSYQRSARLIILMITVNLDGLVYALSTWKYERERQTPHASVKEQFGFMGKPIRRVNQDKMSISSIFSGWPR